MYSLLLYRYVDDIAERRAPFREAHLGLISEAYDRGVMLLAGALVDPLDGGVFVFTTDDRAVVEDFVTRDPYVQEGLVTSWRIRSWNVVKAPSASSP